MFTKEQFVQKFKGMFETQLGDPVRLGQYLVRLLSDSRVPLGAKLKLAGSGLYGFIERDLISDTLRFVPGVGLVDDLILIVHGVRVLIAETDASVAAELWPGDEVSFERSMKSVVWLDDALFGNVRSAVMEIFSSRRKNGGLVPWLARRR